MNCTFFKLSLDINSTSTFLDNSTRIASLPNSHTFLVVFTYSSWKQEGKHRTIECLARWMYFCSWGFPFLLFVFVLLRTGYGMTTMTVSHRSWQFRIAIRSNFFVIFKSPHPFIFQCLRPSLSSLLLCPLQKLKMLFESWNIASHWEYNFQFHFNLISSCQWRNNVGRRTFVCWMGSGSSSSDIISRSVTPLSLISVSNNKHLQVIRWSLFIKFWWHSDMQKGPQTIRKFEFSCVYFLNYIRALILNNSPKHMIRYDSREVGR